MLTLIGLCIECRSIVHNSMRKIFHLRLVCTFLHIVYVTELLILILVYI